MIAGKMGSISKKAEKIVRFVSGQND